jgi:hypothetical protein
MGILGNTVSLQQYDVLGELPRRDLDAWFGACLGKGAFRPIDDTAEERSVGWVHLEDDAESAFANPHGFRRDRYVFFALRRDQRKIPASLLRARVRREHARYLADHPGLKSVPKRRRDEIFDRIQHHLLARTLPAPATFDAVWDLETGVLSVTTLSAKVHEVFEDLFARTFEGFRLVAVHPFARAEKVVPAELKKALAAANGARTDDVAAQIAENRWIGWDFLAWLLFHTVQGGCDGVVDRPGPAVKGEKFEASVSDRLLLYDVKDEGTQKIAITGPQGDFAEARRAIASGKKIGDAAIRLERGDDLWKLTLKGDLFSFGGFKTPKVRLDEDTPDEAAEREALFFERMALLTTGLQLFDSLFAAFLAERLGASWPKFSRKLHEWAKGG